MIKKRWIVVVFIIVLLSTAASVYSQDPLAQGGKRTIGLIFNAPSILLEIESYQAGMGLKLWAGNFAFRFLGDFFGSNSSDTFSFDVGVAAEYHLLDGRVSPYVGGFVSSGLTSQTTTVDDDNWVQATTVPITGGAIFGAEFYLFEFLSLFAEYNLAIDFLITNTDTSVLGTVTTDSSNSFVFDAGVGNNSKIGIVIYLK